MNIKIYLDTNLIIKISFEVSLVKMNAINFIGKFKKYIKSIIN